MTALRAIVAAFACFSTIPMPRIRWDDACMRFMLAAFPLVGAGIGGVEFLWAHLVGHIAMGALLWGAGLTLIPLLITGGIHLDGFADVVDALSSHAEPRRKQEILKDPHVGAFAVIGICGYVLAYVALSSELAPARVGLLACAHVASRCLAGLAVVSFRPAREEGMYASMGGSAQARTVRLLLVAIFGAAAGAMLCQDPRSGALALVAALIVLFRTRGMAERAFGGMSGDLSGYSLQLMELVMLACFVLVGKLV